jgi:hypothetical protein
MREFIESSYKDRASCGKNDQTLANMIQEQITGTLGGNKYINELLQNADDACAVCDADPSKGDSCQKSTNVTFTLIGDYLIFSHDGRHFSEKDVEGIANSADPNRKKVEDPNSTGYKGIGFRSAFNISDCIMILSKEATFKFDKEHTEWKDKNDKYPWPIIPIYFERSKIPQEIIGFCNPEKVVFAFKLKANIKNSVEDSLNQLITQTSILLFQRHTKSIKYRNIENKSIIEIKKENIENGKCVLKKNEQLESTWLIHDITWNLSPSYCAQLKTKNIPKKFQDAKTVKIQYAAPADLGAVQKNVTNNVLFFRFPTQIRLNIPFLANAHFLLNSERTQFQETPDADFWNNTLINSIARGQFFWFSSLVEKNRDFTQFLPLSLIAIPSNLGWIVNNQRFRASFEQGYQSGVSEKYFIVSQTNSIVKTSDCLIDECHFIQEFGTDNEKSKSAHQDYQPDQVKNLKLLGIKSFDLTQIVEKIRSSEFQKRLRGLQNVDDHCKFIQLIFNIFRTNPGSLKGTPLILTTDGKLSSFEEAFMPDEKFKYTIEGVKINLVHAVLVDLIKNNEELKEWMRKTELKNLTLGSLVNLVNKNENKSENLHKNDCINLCQSMIQYKKQFGNIHKEDLAHLRGLNLITRTGKFLRPDKCYLPNKLFPTLSLEEISKGFNGFLSLDYLENDDEIEKWKEFFIDIGVAPIPTQVNIKELIGGIDSEEHHFLFLKAIFKVYKVYKVYKDDNNSISEIITSDNFKDVLVKTKKEVYIQPNACYLADIYNPAKKLEDLTQAINFVSKDYIENKEEISVWNHLFCSIGVQSKINVNVHNAPWSYEQLKTVSPEYLIHLWDQNTLHCFDNELGTTLCPVATRGYSSQHSISSFVEIDFIQHIRGTPVFWMVVQENWHSIESCCSEVIYKTQRSSRKVISNLYYEATRSIENLYPQRNISDFYPPNFKLLQAGSDILSIADIGVELTDAQIKFFGFKSILSVEDALSLLEHFQTLEFSTQLFENIKVVWRHLLCHKDKQLPNQRLASIKLPNEQGQFIDLNELYGFTIPSSYLHCKEVNPHFLMRPKDFSEEEFFSLCEFFSITVIKKSDLVLFNIENSQSEDFLKQSFLENASYIVASELLYKEIGGNEAIIKQELQNFLKNINDLTFIPLKKLFMKYETIFQQEVRCWVSLDKFYYKEQMDRFTKQEIWKKIQQHFQLTTSSEDLDLLMSDEGTRLAWLEEKGGKAKILYQNVVKVISRNELSEVSSSLSQVALGAENDEGEMDLSSSEDSKVDVEQHVHTGFSQPAGSLSQGVSPNRASQIYKSGFSAEYTTLTGDFSDNLKERNNDVPEPFPKRQKLNNATYLSPSSSPKAIKNTSATSSGDDYTLTAHYMSQTQTQTQTNVKTGEKGEKHTFEYLFKKYQEKDKYTETKHTEDGFLAKTQQGSSVELFWFNKNRETYAPYDMKFIKKNDQDTIIKEQFIEVKSNSGEAGNGIFSEGEWEILKNNPNNYVVYHVENISSSNPSQPTKIKNLYNQIIENKEIVKERERKVIERVVNFRGVFSTLKKSDNTSNTQSKNESSSEQKKVTLQKLPAQ